MLLTCFSLPEPSLPDFSLFLYVIKDAIVISVIAFTTSVSVSDLYARKHKYRINSNKVCLNDSKKLTL
jgi:MFS superfamily sulfate permease-like transporter